MGYVFGMSINEAAEVKGLGSFDYSLPQEWVDKVNDLLPCEFSVIGNIVWCYRWDKAAFSDTFGRPVAVTPHGEMILGFLAAGI